MLVLGFVGDVGRKESVCRFRQICDDYNTLSKYVFQRQLLVLLPAKAAKAGPKAELRGKRHKPVRLA